MCRDRLYVVHCPRELLEAANRSRFSAKRLTGKTPVVIKDEEAQISTPVAIRLVVVVSHAQQ